MNKITFIKAMSIFVITGCNEEINQKEQSKLASQIVTSMVTVEGGRYQMGDFGSLIGEKLPFSPDNDNKPLHWVDLTSFKMTKNRITWGSLIYGYL